MREHCETIDFILHCIELEGNLMTAWPSIVSLEKKLKKDRRKHRAYFISCRKLQYLDLETTRRTATTGSFKLASLGANVGFDVSVCVRVVDRRSVTKV